MDPQEGQPLLREGHVIMKNVGGSVDLSCPSFETYHTFLMVWLDGNASGCVAVQS